LKNAFNRCIRFKAFLLVEELDRTGQEKTGQDRTDRDKRSITGLYV
jgi:hypothetical protein